MPNAAFAYPNPDDVLVADAGRGLRLVFIGIEPDFRLPLEGYYGFLALKNGVPVSYGGGWELFGALDFAINIFASFRQGESPYLATQLLPGPVAGDLRRVGPLGDDQAHIVERIVME